MVRSLTRACIRRRRWVLTLWVLVLFAGLSAGPLVFGRLSSDVGTISSSESARAGRLLDRLAPTGDEIYAVVDGRAATDPDLRATVEAATSAVRGIVGVTSVRTPWSGGGPAMVARDGHAVAITVTFSPDRPGTGEVHAAAARLRAIPAPRVIVGGGPLQDDEMTSQAAADLAHAETLSTPVVLVLLLVLFGGFLAAGLPLFLALIGIAGTFAGLLGLSLVLDVSVYSINIVTMLGLGLAVDYSLLIVSRFREERGGAGDLAAVVERTMVSAGRTVLFSGLTVAAALSGLLLFPDDFLRSMGFGAFCVVLIDMLAALTVLPALLSVIGARIRPATDRRREGRLFLQVARGVRRRPVLVLIGVAGILILPALPFASARYSDADARSLPPSSPSRQLQEMAVSRFGSEQQTAPVTIVTGRSLSPEEERGYLAVLRGLDGARSVTPRSAVPGHTVIDVVPAGSSQGTAAMRLVREVRRTPAAAPVMVAGDAAELSDYSAALAHAAPFALGLIVLATAVLLFLFTGSVVVPVKAILTNLLSLGASFGALVWVFQEGHLGGLFGTEALGSLSVTTPVLVFAIAFGLSMDYEVFLLGRIAEFHRRTGETDLAVERGLQRTGGILTAAALLIAVVFAGFVAGGFSPVKQVGLGLVLAVTLDATLVRMLLVPAVMTLMGDWNWWAPPILRRAHNRLGIADHPDLPATRPAEPAARSAIGVLVD
jgi:RND superfamily putative drug exporter